MFYKRYCYALHLLPILRLSLINDKLVSLSKQILNYIIHVNVLKRRFNSSKVLSIVRISSSTRSASSRYMSFSTICTYATSTAFLTIHFFPTCFFLRCIHLNYLMTFDDRSSPTFPSTSTIQTSNTSVRATFTKLTPSHLNFHRP